MIYLILSVRKVMFFFHVCVSVPFPLRFFEGKAEFYVSMVLLKAPHETLQWLTN